MRLLKLPLSRPLPLILVTLLTASVTAIPVMASGAVPTQMDNIINLEVKGAEAVDALRMIAKLAGFSLVADSSVKGTLTIDLKGLSVKDALDILSVSNGWAWNKVGNTVVVGDANKIKESVEPPSMAVFQLKYAQASEVLPKLGLVVTANKVQVDARTNTLIVSGTPAEVSKLRSLIDVLDVPVKAEAPVKQPLTSKIKVLAIGGTQGSFMSLLKVGDRQIFVSDGDVVAEGIKVQKISSSDVAFDYEGETSTIGLEGGIK